MVLIKLLQRIRLLERTLTIVIVTVVEQLEAQAQGLAVTVLQAVKAVDQAALLVKADIQTVVTTERVAVVVADIKAEPEVFIPLLVEEDQAMSHLDIHQ